MQHAPRIVACELAPADGMLSKAVTPQSVHNLCNQNSTFDIDRWCTRAVFSPQF